MYYSANGILGKKALFNYVSSDRSDGKTFDIFYRAVNRWRNGFQTIYVRRWDKTINKTMMYAGISDVFNKCKNFSNLEYKLIDRCMHISEKGKEKFTPCIHFGALSKVDDLKSAFNPEYIREIDIDEYCPVNPRWLPDEMTAIFELYESADRNRDVVQLMVFGNRLRPLNPFTQFFGLTSELNRNGIKLYRNGTLAVQSWGSEENREKRKNNRLHQLVQGTDYGEYLENGQTLYGFNSNFMFLPNDARIFCRFQTVAGIGAIFYDNKRLIITTRNDYHNMILCDKASISIESKGQNISSQLSKIRTYIKNLYYKNLIKYESREAMRAFSPIIQETV